MSFCGCLLGYRINVAFFFFPPFHSSNNHYRTAATPDENAMLQFNKAKENKADLNGPFLLWGLRMGFMIRVCEKFTFFNSSC